MWTVTKILFILGCLMATPMVRPMDTFTIIAMAGGIVLLLTLLSDLSNGNS